MIPRLFPAHELPFGKIGGFGYQLNCRVNGNKGFLFDRGNGFCYFFRNKTFGLKGYIFKLSTADSRILIKILI